MRVAVIRGGRVATLRHARCLWSTPQRREVKLTETVSHPRELLFDVVADVGRYSEFVPYCGSSTVLTRRDGGRSFDAELSLGFMAFTEDYVSRVDLQRPSSIIASASETPLFTHLRTEWRFDAIGPESCQLHFHLDMLLRSLVYDQALKRVIDLVAAQQVAAFKRRCDEVAVEWRTSQQQQQQQQQQPVAASAAASVGAAFTKPATAQSAAALPAFSYGFLQAEPAWRQRVDRAFDSHAINGSLTLPRFVEACRALRVMQTATVPLDTSLVSNLDSANKTSSHQSSSLDTAMEAELSQAVLAAWFVEFDEDASGHVDRDEFVRNLWLLTRASEAERMAHAFHQLDANGSGALERGDLIVSMRKQLTLARRIVPLLVRHQMRREAATNGLPISHFNGSSSGAAWNDGDVLSSSAQSGGNGNGGSGASPQDLLHQEASAAASKAIDDLDDQVELLVADVFASFGEARSSSSASSSATELQQGASDGDDGEEITFEEWRAAWERGGEDELLGSVLGLAGRGALRPREEA